MPTFVSKMGEWYPAKEQIGLVNKSDKPIQYNGKTIQPGEHFIYEGADREAIRMLHEQGSENAEGDIVIGSKFKNHPEFLQATRNMGFNTVEEYLKTIGYDEEKELKEFNKRSEQIKAHDLPDKVKEVMIVGGGKDLSGNKDNDIIGGFGEQKIRKPAEAKSSENNKTEA